MAEKAQRDSKKAQAKKAPAQNRGGTAKKPPRGVRFGEGQKGNPGGRPKLPPELKEAARALSPEALRVLAEIMRDPEAPEAARVSAAEKIMNRAYGTPPASVEITNLSDLPRIIIEAAP